MKKRLISIVTVIALCLASVSPAGAEDAFFSAEEYEETLFEEDVIFGDEEELFPEDEDGGFIPETDEADLFFEEEEDGFPLSGEFSEEPSEDIFEAASEETVEEETPASGEAPGSAAQEPVEMPEDEESVWQEDRELAGEAAFEAGYPAEDLEESLEAEETAGDTPYAAGTCGDNVTWSLYSVTGTTYRLVIGGTGPMADYSTGNMPWYSYRSDITTVELENGVTSIGNNAFAYCSSLTGVTIPAGVTSIGNYAFIFCSELADVVIPASVASIGTGAFSNCGSLTGVTIPDGVTSIRERTFTHCGSLRDVALPAGVTSIGSDAFSYCGSLMDISLPAGVTSVGSYAFSNCSSLTGIEIPDGVTSIENRTFYECRGLKSLTIGAGVRHYGEYAFYGCGSLATVNISSAESWLSAEFDDTSYSNPLYGYFTGELCIIRDGSMISEVEIPEGLTSVRAYAFRNCKSLSGVTIPDSVTDIGAYAFSGCENLTEVTIPDNVTSIGSSAFDGCSGLKGVTLGDGVTDIGYYTFNGCRGLTGIVLPDGLTSIGSHAFSRCSGLTEITIPDNVTSIGEYAFYDCSGLKSVTIGDSVTSFGGSAFYYCSGIETVNITSVEAWLSASFASSGSDPSSYADELRIIRNGEPVTDVVIPQGITSIRAGAFRNCISLSSVTIPAGVTGIGDEAFLNTGVSAVRIEGSDVAFGADVFKNCADPVLYCRAGSNVISYAKENGFSYVIDGSCGPDASWSLFPLENDKYRLEIAGSGSMDSFTSGSSVPWKDYAAGITEADIAEGITSIGSYAFSGCSALTEIEIPDSVTTIGYYAFRGCVSLADVTIGEGAVNFGNYAFYNCSGLRVVSISSIESWLNAVFGGSASDPACYADELRIIRNGESVTEVDIPDGTTAIRANAFRNCTGLSGVTIPDSVTSIGDEAFYNTGLSAVRIEGSSTAFGADVFRDCPDLVIYCRAGSDAAAYAEQNGIPFVIVGSCGSKTEWSLLPLGNDNYRLVIEGTGDMDSYASDDDVPWKDFAPGITEIGIAEGITAIGSYAFSGCGITSVDVPDSVRSIGEYAFGNCGGLTTVGITGNSGLTSISPNIFAGSELAKVDSVPGTAADALCFDNHIPVLTEIISVSLPETEIVLKPGETYVLVPGFVSEPAAVSVVCSWRSDAEDAAAVAADGTVTALSEGTAVITVSVRDISAACTVVVGSRYVITSLPLLSGTYGDEAGEMQLTGGAVTLDGETVSGVWTVTDASAAERPEVGTERDYEVTFTEDGGQAAISARVVPSVSPRSISAEGVQVSAEETGLVYDGTPKEAAVTVTDSGAVITEDDYVIEYRNNINAGSAEAVITGTGNYAGERSVPFRIGKADLAVASITLPQEVYYEDGTGIEPEPTVVFGGQTLTAGTDYRLSYRNNIAPGTGAVIASAVEESNFSGTVRTFFSIEKNPEAERPTILSLENVPSGVSLTWTEVDAASGYYIYRSGLKIQTVSDKSVTCYTDTGADEPGAMYTYQVSAYVDAGDFAYVRSASDERATYYVPQVTVIAVTARPDGEYVEWSPVSGISGYRLLRGSEVVLTITDHTVSSHLDTDARTCGGEYGYTVEAYLDTDAGEVSGAPSEAAYSERGHFYADWTTLSEPACTESGVRERTCTVCGTVEVQDLPAYGHTWDTEYTVDLETSCGRPGVKSIHCTVCGEINGETVEEIPALEHDYGDWVVKEEPSCERSGLQESTCRICGLTRAMVLPVKGHSFSAWNYISMPTCTVEGRIERTCSDCGKTEVEDLPVYGHIWDANKTVDREAACTEPGQRSVHCTVCGEIREDSVEEIPALGHSFGEWTVTDEPACAQPGWKKQVCEHCGKVISEEIPATGHSFRDWVVKEAPDCEKPGRRERTCDDCGTVEETEIPATGHSFGRWKLVKAPTCEAEGTLERGCSACATIETETIEKAEHSWETNYTVDREPTRTEEGVKSIHCAVCGAIREGSEVPIEKLPEITLDKPEIRTILNVSAGVRLKWEHVPGAEGYTVYRDGGELARQSATGAAITYTDATAENNTRYTYIIEAYAGPEGGGRVSSSSDEKEICYLSRPEISSVTNTSAGVKIAWEKIEGASGYYVYRGSTRIKTVSAGSLNYTDNEAENNSGYTYKIYAYKSESGLVSKSTVSRTVQAWYLSRPVISQVGNVAGGPKVAWTAIEGADGYDVYRGGELAASAVKGTSYTDSAGTQDGTKYAYKIRARKTVSGKTYVSTLSTEKFTYFMSRPVISSASNSAAGELTVTWGKNAKANGWQVKYALGDEEKTVTISSGSTVTRKITGLKKGSSYKVYVRSFRTVSDKKYFSTWSAYKTAKITK